MPKIRVANTAEEAAKVPQDQPVEINLSANNDPAPQEIFYGRQDGKPIVPPQKVVEPPKPEANDEGEPSLEKQLKQLKDTEERARQRAQQAEADRAAMIQQAQQRDREIQNLRRQAQGSHHETLVSSIAAVQADAESAQAALANALAAGDHASAAEAQRKISRAEVRLVQLEAGKEELERRLQQPQPQPAQHQIPLPSPNPVEAMLQQMPNLIDSERDYLRNHPEALTNPANQRRLEVAWLDAQNQGIKRGSDEYFKFFDDRLGYKSQRREEAVDDDDDGGGRMVAAPVSRNVPSASRESDTRVVLSPQQREAARWAGVDETEYAKQLVKLKQLKRDGYYDEGRS